MGSLVCVCRESKDRRGNHAIFHLRRSNSGLPDADGDVQSAFCGAISPSGEMPFREATFSGNGSGPTRQIALHGCLS
jgi:hypothetical protein